MKRKWSLQDLTLDIYLKLLWRHISGFKCVYASNGYFW